MPRFVLEIGTEEIPPRYFPVALPHLAEEGKALLQRARLWLPESDTKVYGTPRRLVFIGEDIAAVQAPAVREERGPAVKVAFGADGKPTKATEGFARRWGLTPDKLERRETDQGEYVFAVIQEPELPAAQALAPLLPSLITGIPFPKTMRWGVGNLRFGRPIRWLLALVDDEVVEFELEGLKSGRLTRGHPVLAEGMYEVGNASEYEQVLAQHVVTVDTEQRKRDLRSLLTTLAGAKQASLVDGGLLDETVYLVESPTVALGGFEEGFLSLPRPVLVEEMRHVQCYFPLEDQQGKLLPGFIAVRDGGDEHLGTVVEGWESVLRSKLIDASYFYEQDLKTPLADRVEALKGVVFQEKLGTMYEKMERVRAVAAELAGQLGLNADRREWLDRAALLCKADLTTEVVTDLGHLQGVMGAIYAETDGEPQEVWKAIRDHYRPLSADDDTPETTIGTFLALADKMDTITACFAAGIVPTGSADPFGLRRESTGTARSLECLLTRLLAEGSFPTGVAWNWMQVSVSRMARACLGKLREQVDIAPADDEIVSGVTDLLSQRVETYLREQDIPYDLVRAAIASGTDRLRDAASRARALHAKAGGDQNGFLLTVIAATRPINISREFGGGEVDEALLTEPAERALWAAFQRAEQAGDDLWGTDGKYDEPLFYRRYFDILSALREPIDTFFTDVLVMHEDPEIRRNRLALCWQVSQLFRRLADFSLIVQT